MRTLTPQEKRTIRLAAAGIAIYLILFCGFKLWRALERSRAEYQLLVKQAQELKSQIALYQTRTLVVDKLMKDFQMDPAKLTRASVVGQASAAIQQAAMAGGIQVGPIREATARSSTKELASVQIEGAGPIPAAMSLLHRLQSLGYPLIIDSVQLTPESIRPGQVKLNLTVIILDFDQWKGTAAPHA